MKRGGPALIWTLGKRIAGSAAVRAVPHGEEWGERIQHRGQLLASALGTAPQTYAQSTLPGYLLSAFAFDSFVTIR